MQPNHSSRHLRFRLMLWPALLLASFAILPVTSKVQAAGKGGTTTTKDYAISIRFWLDDVHPLSGLPNRVVADSAAAYFDGVDNVRAYVGPGATIVMNLQEQYKKPAIRHYIFAGGFPEVLPPTEFCAPSGMRITSDRPVLATGIPQLNTIQIYGANHDDSAPGYVRHVNARYHFKDDNYRTWAIYYGSRVFPDSYRYAPCGSCMSVERLPNTSAATSLWRFWTEPDPTTLQHLGYLYLLEFDPKLPPIFAGIVDAPSSGLIESLTVEPEPPSDGYVVPENPAECP